MTAPSPELGQIRARYATFRDRTVEERSVYAELLTRVPARERVLLETCHRVELVSVDDASEPAPGASGEAAVRRVFEVVAGLDSAVIAEEELLGQARSAYEAALASRATGPILNELFRRALRFGRRVRSHATPGGDRSLADVGARWLLRRLGGVRARVVVAGTGTMGRHVAGALADAGHDLTILSGSAERAAAVARSLGERHGGVAGHGTLPPPLAREAAAIVLAVRPRTPLLDVEHLESEPRPLVLDLSAPPSVTARAADLLGGHLMSLDRLTAAAGTAPALAPSVERRLRTELEREVDRFAAWVEARRSSDAVAILRGEAEAIRRRHVDRLRRRAGLAAPELEAVDAATAAMVGELLHGPSVELRAGGADAAAIRRIFRLGR